MYALGSRAPTPPPPPHGIPPRSRTTATNPRKPEGGRTMEIHRSGEPHQSRDRGTVCKEKRATSYFVWSRARNDDITANKRQQPYHITVEHTAPHRRGGANQNDHRPHPTGGGEDKACNDDITTNKRQQPYNTSVEHTAPHRRGGANQKDHRPHSTGGEGPRRRGKQQGQTRQLPT